VPHVGGLDGHGRPIVRVRVTGAEDELVCLVDTGYSGELWMSQALAKQFRFVATGMSADAATATDDVAKVEIFLGEIEWLGAKREVTVHAHGNDTRPARPAGEEPYALLGSALLRPAVLNVDYPNHTLSIT
jgi:predicted aspartyl protease